MDRGEWKTDLVHRLFDDISAKAILHIPFSNYDQKDILKSFTTRSGNYSVKSAYFTNHQSKWGDSTLLNSHKWKKLWKSNIMEKPKMFIWRLISGAIQTKATLVVCFHVEDPYCPFCSTELETVEHPFFLCPCSQSLWFTKWGLRTDLFSHFSIMDWCNTILNPSILFYYQGIDEDQFTSWAVFFLDNFWQSRNLLIHEKRQLEPQQFLKSISQCVNAFLEANKVPTLPTYP
ncbi:hypothetical protein L1049_021425 [Liquidambar formosana]|uniref:Reverse transcriptase zinc-binding domain-containing protein n=1 Tax=Liquidambar formosana TaxID=63359 RepID=A0AAP0N7D6_LIQFO